jgi:hypothetical protein
LSKKGAAMNKNWRIALVVASTGGIARADDVTSHSYLAQRQFFQSADPIRESFFRNDVMEARIDGWGGAFQIVPFGGKSYNESDIAKYFMPFGKTSLSVVEFQNNTATPDGAANRDLEARHFNIETNNSVTFEESDVPNSFQSVISFCPKQTVVGVGFEWKQALCRRDDDSVRFYFEASFPFVHVENNMNLTERIINDGNGAVDALGLDNAPRVANMTQAFRQASWKFGKVPGCTLVKNGVSDLELKLGWNTIDSEMCHMNTYVGIIVPTGDRPTGEFLFEPVTGPHHTGVQWGNNIGFEVWSCRDHMVTFEIDTNARYLFRADEVRSFDVYDQSWSRYKEVYRNQEEAQAALSAGSSGAGTSGINVFTKCLEVSPRYRVTSNSAFVYKYCHFMGEIGYNFYAAHAEEVNLCKWNEEVQFKDISGLGNTNIARTIRNNFTNEAIALANYSPIPKSQLNLESAATPAVLTNIIYGSIGYNWGDRCYPTFVSIGGSVEFTQANTALNRWMVWGKMGVSY